MLSRVSTRFLKLPVMRPLCRYLNWFICSPAGGHLCRFHFLALMNMVCYE